MAIDTPSTGARSGRSPLDLFRDLDIDTRLVGMIVVLVAIWVLFHVASEGSFLTPRNLWNLAVQTSVVGIMVAGMVFVLVTRHVDLSVGSVLGFVGMVMAVIQTEILPSYLSIGHGAIWIIALLGGLAVGALIGAAQGAIIAHAAVPAFIVTLGGLLIFRGGAWWITSGRTVAPMDDNFQVLGGGVTGAIGATPSWIIGVIVSLVIVLVVWRGRARRQSFGFPVRPVWAEVLVTALAVAAVLGFVAVMNAYPLPAGVAAQIWAQRGIVIPPGQPVPPIASGIPVPVLIMIAVVAIMAFVAARTRFGRYVYAIGGNPDAAKLAGVNVRRVTIAIFAIMGLLAAIAGAVATARANAGANVTGSLAELTTIAAAVIGGTSLAGGVGTVVGALLGALIMQSLVSGMGLVGIDTPLQNIAIGIVLIIAVWLDTLYRARQK